MKTLVIFDFDDTLFRTGSRIIVRSSSGSEKFLTTHKYPLYRPSPGDEFDFSEFEVYPPSPSPIEKTVEKFKKFVATTGIQNVIILTARANAAPVREVLKDFDLPPVEVIAVGNSAPEAKSEFVESRILKKGYDSIVLYEDNDRNIAEICLKMFDLEVPCCAYKVMPNGSIQTIIKEFLQD